MKTGVAINGAPKIANIKFESGKYQYPKRTENDNNNANIIAKESEKSVMSCLENLDKFRIFLIIINYSNNF